jgi:hypothetical protein
MRRVVENKRGLWFVGLSKTCCKISALQDLCLEDNCLHSLPDELSSLSKLKKLGLSDNYLRSLPDELSSLSKLEGLDLSGNFLPGVPISVLSSLTALTSICIASQDTWEEGSPLFRVPSPLLPILHPGLELLALFQAHPWDQMSLFHLGRALAEVADRRPQPELKF